MVGRAWCATAVWAQPGQVLQAQLGEQQGMIQSSYNGPDQRMPKCRLTERR